MVKEIKDVWAFIEGEDREEDGKKLFEDIEKIYNMPGGKERYWDQVSLNYCKKNYNVAIRECQFSDIVEIDTFNELKAIDKAYDI